MAKNSLLGLALAAMLGATACASGQAQSKIAQGQPFRSGNADYDRFFDTMHALQQRVAGASNELADARQNLTDAVVISKTTSSDALAERVKSELDRVGRNGARVRVDFVTPASLDESNTRAVLAPASKPRAVDATLIRQVENSLTRMLRVDVSMRRTREELSALCKVALRLESSLDSSFARGSRHDEVAHNLRDAERLITLMLGQTEEVPKPSMDFMAKLSVALGSPLKNQPARIQPADANSEQRVAHTPKSNSGAAPAEQPAPVTRADFEP